jgi:hypothetical protein
VTGTRGTGIPEEEEDGAVPVLVVEVCDEDDEDDPPAPGGEPRELEHADDAAAAAGPTRSAANSARRNDLVLSSMRKRIPILAIESKLQKVSRDPLQQYIRVLGEDARWIKADPFSRERPGGGDHCTSRSSW